jgi:hypothetical protein
MTRYDFCDCLRPSGVDANAIATKVQAMPISTLPLAAACNHGGHIDAGSLRASTVRTVPGAQETTVTIGMFFDELIGGCNCSDDPAAATGYAEFDVCIDLASGHGVIRPTSEVG